MDDLGSATANNQVVKLSDGKVKIRWAFKKLFMLILLWPFLTALIGVVITRTNPEESISAGQFIGPSIFILFMIIVAFIPFIIINIARLKSLHYFISNGNFVINQGVLKKESRVIPLDKIQNIRINRTFLNRIVGLSSVLLEDASSGSLSEIDSSGEVEIAKNYSRDAVGFSGNRVNLPALKHADATAIIEAVKG